MCSPNLRKGTECHEKGREAGSHKDVTDTYIVLWGRLESVRD